MIAVCVPAVSWMYTRSVMSLLQMFRDDLPPGSRFTIEDGFSSCPVKRNDMVRRVLRYEPDVTHILLLDSDMVFPPGTVPRLLAHAKDVVGILYTFRFPPFPIVGSREVESSDVPPIGPGQGLQRVGRLGGACMLIQRRVVEAIEAPWFLEPTSGLANGDDYYFSDQVRAAGFELWADTDLEVGHMTVAPVTPHRAGLWRAALEER